MRLRFLVWAMPVITSSLAAQTSYSVSPRYVDHHPSAGHPCRVLGMHKNSRLQCLDGELRGKAVSLKEITLRRSYTSLSTNENRGRRWGNVRILLGDGDYHTFRSNYTSNWKSTPTSVFSASVAWPALGRGYPPTNPPAWGGPTGAYRFPFSSSYPYSGRNDFISDFSFTGGVLANNGHWGQQDYFFDSTATKRVQVLGKQRAIPTTVRCRDSRVSAYARSNILATHGSSHHYSDGVWRARLEILSSCFDTGYGNPVIHAWGLQQSLPGINVGTGCARLHALSPYVLFLRTGATSVGNYSRAYVSVPWNASYKNRVLTLQVAWSDSRNGNFLLTPGSDVTTPSVVPNWHTARRKTVHSYINGSLSVPNTRPQFVPAFRYRH